MLIGELARRTEVSKRSLRYYEAQGLLSAARGVNGYREYDEESQATVRRVRTLLDAGLSTEVIRELLPCARGEGAGFAFELCGEVREVLGRELASTDARIDGLRRSREALAGYLSPV
ncbi:MerR family transcriptional regulator [Streptomyces uncialis]|uniref:MerR family transcriptional regulator n=1 Tax=Streptomyces uncialis TaxID=1048205 RepID=UPI002E324D9C|nr:MerR family transcriptional regulator [Streptomyces uncialis]WTE10796.1 MerR family transcriptional regulator [Streptomyces uncialis]